VLTYLSAGRSQPTPTENKNIKSLFICASYGRDGKNSRSTESTNPHSSQSIKKWNNQQSEPNSLLMYHWKQQSRQKNFSFWQQQKWNNTTQLFSSTTDKTVIRNQSTIHRLHDLPLLGSTHRNLQIPIKLTTTRPVEITQLQKNMHSNDSHHYANKVITCSL